MVRDCFTIIPDDLRCSSCAVIAHFHFTRNSIGISQGALATVLQLRELFNVLSRLCAAR